METPDGMETRNALRSLNPAKAEVQWQGNTLPFVGSYFDGATPVYRYVAEGREVHFNPQNEVFQAIRHQDGETFTLSPVSVDGDVIQLSTR